MATVTHRALVSFIGGTDIRFIDAKDQDVDQSPVWRLVSHACKKSNAPELRVLLFRDRTDPQGRQQESMFVDRLREKIKQTKIQATVLEPFDTKKPNGLPIEGPTSYDDLYWFVSSALKKRKGDIVPSGTQVEYWFHVSSGSPAMQVALHWVASSLSFGNDPRIWETSRYGPKEIRFPVRVAVLERKTLQPVDRIDKPLLDLLPDLVILDPQVTYAFSQLSEYSKRNHPIAVVGPPGSGKRRAIDQLLQWRGGTLVADWQFDQLPEDWLEQIGSGKGDRRAVIIRGLPDVRLPSSPSLQKAFSLIAAMASAQDKVMVVLSGSCKALEWLQALEPKPIRVVLPPLALRSDVAEIAQRMIESEGLGAGCADFRSRYDYMLRVGIAYLDGLWTLRQLARGVAAASAGRTVTAGALRVALSEEQSMVAKEVQAYIFSHLANPHSEHWSSGTSAKDRTLPLPELLEALEHATILVQCPRFKAKTKSAIRLGYPNDRTFGNRLISTQAPYAKVVERLYPDQHEANGSLMS